MRVHFFVLVASGWENFRRFYISFCVFSFHIDKKKIFCGLVTFPLSACCVCVNDLCCSKCPLGPWHLFLPY
jgi:hypothetical protein